MHDHKPRCSVCDMEIRQQIIPRCSRCEKAVCSPYLRDCAYEHWRIAHAGRPRRRVQDVKAREVV